MGRTLSWDIRPKGKLLFDVEDLKVMYQIDKTADASCEWTCDGFDLSPGIYPNWDVKSDWNKLNAKYRELLKEGIHPADINFQLVEEKLVCLHNPEWQKEIKGFCKVGGNELNAAVIVGALVEVSKKVRCSIELRDEGKYLICPLIIEKGKARPDNEQIDKTIGYYVSRRWEPDYKNCECDWDAMAKELYDFKNKYRSKKTSYNYGWAVEEFCREIKPEDFQNHPEYGASQLMAGFGGEYYGLNKKDPEAESYRACANIQKMLGVMFGDKAKNMKIEIGKDIRKQGKKRNKD